MENFIKHYNLSYPMITFSYPNRFCTFFSLQAWSCDMQVFLTFTVQIMTFELFPTVKKKFATWFVLLFVLHWGSPIRSYQSFKLKFLCSWCILSFWFFACFFKLVFPLLLTALHFRVSSISCKIHLHITWFSIANSVSASLVFASCIWRGIIDMRNLKWKTE